MFSVRRGIEEDFRGERSPEEPRHVLFREPHRLPNRLLSNTPVNLLTVERGFSTKPLLNYKRDAWKKLIGRIEAVNQPQVVIETWLPNAQLWIKGPCCKSTTTHWHKLELNK